MMEIYFDNASTTKPLAEVMDGLHKQLAFYANPSSLHRLGFEAGKLLNEARAFIAKSLGVLPSECIFTSGGTESNNMAVIGLAEAYKREGMHIVSTDVEHPSVFNALNYLEGKGFKVTRINMAALKERSLTECVEAALTSETILVSIMHVNNETGDIFAIEELARKLKSKNIRFHSDGVQGYLKEKIDLRLLDAYSFSAHKIHGLKGVGGLYLKKRTKLKPLLYGGEQGDGLRPGTENLPGILAFRTAAEQLLLNWDRDAERVREIRDFLVQSLADLAMVNSLSQEDRMCSPYIVNLSFPQMKAQILMQALDSAGIYVSTGSACNGKLKAGHSQILTNMGFSRERAECALRLSFSHFNHLEEAQMFEQRIREIIKKYAQILKK